jgi:shikimate kinase
VSDRGPIVLVGMIGAGKTTVGRALAARLGTDFVDTDDLVAVSAGCSIRELFERHGEAHFRRVEASVLEEVLSAITSGVVGGGGGIVTTDPNRRLLKDAPATVVWLRATPSSLAGRLDGDTDRPLLDGDAMERLNALSAERGAWYADVAEFVVDVDDRSIDDIVDEILEAGP